MENDDIKSLWKGINTPQKSTTQFSQMVKEQNHPVLKSIKRQALFEFIAFTVFLFCYYSMFDGIEKPLVVNLILVFALMVNMIHHLKRYRLQQKFRAGSNLLDDVKNFAKKLKVYQIEALTSKALLVIAMMIFFTIGIKLTEIKWLAIGIIAIVFILQLILINNIWQKRRTRIKKTIQEFEGA